jgi:hypothetical protein
VLAGWQFARVEPYFLDTVSSVGEITGREGYFYGVRQRLCSVLP